METRNELERRLTDLEVKASFADDLLDQLNKTVFRQQRQIEWLLRELAELRRQDPGAGDTAGSLRDNIPPHY